MKSARWNLCVGLTTKAVVSTSLLFIRSSRVTSHLSPSCVTNFEKVTLALPYLQGMMEVRSGPLAYRKRASSEPTLTPETQRQQTVSDRLIHSPEPT